MQKTTMASNHKHIIGLLYKRDGHSLVTVDDLRIHMQQQKAFNDMLMRDPCFAELQWMLRPRYTFKDYGDRRCNVGLHRFAHCPECGAAINWKSIKETPE